MREAGLTEACALVAAGWGGDCRISSAAESGVWRYGARPARRRSPSASTSTARGDFNGQISTGLRFLDHMLAQIAHHGGVALAVEAHGDLDIDEHHTVEDVAITLGEAIDRALGSRPASRATDSPCRWTTAGRWCSSTRGRIDFEWEAEFGANGIGDVPTGAVPPLLPRALLGGALQPPDRGPRRKRAPQGRGDLQGLRTRPARMAVARQGFGYDIPSSKGVL